MRRTNVVPTRRRSTAFAACPANRFIAVGGLYPAVAWLQRVHIAADLRLSPLIRHMSTCGNRPDALHNVFGLMYRLVAVEVHQRID